MAIGAFVTGVYIVVVYIHEMGNDVRDVGMMMVLFCGDGSRMKSGGYRG